MATVHTSQIDMSNMSADEIGKALAETIHKAASFFVFVNPEELENLRDLLNYPDYERMTIESLLLSLAKKALLSLTPTHRELKVMAQKGGRSFFISIS